MPLLILPLFLVAASGQPTPQRGRGFATAEEQPVKAELITEHASIQHEGTTRAGVLFDIEAGWHIYAQDPGEAGLPTRVEWSGPATVSFGPVTWPTPQAFLDPGDIRTFGYSGSVVVFSPIQHLVADSFTDIAMSLQLAAHVEWLACKELCLPGSANLELYLPVRQERPVLSPHAHLFEQTNVSSTQQ